MFVYEVNAHDLFDLLELESHIPTPRTRRDSTFSPLLEAAQIK